MLKLPNPSPPTKKMKNKKKINIQILQNRGASGPQKKKKNNLPIPFTIPADELHRGCLTGP